MMPKKRDKKSVTNFKRTKIKRDKKKFVYLMKNLQKKKRNVKNFKLK